MTRDELRTRLKDGDEFLAQLGEDIEAARAGQHQVEDDQIGPALERELERLEACVGLDEAIPIAENDAHELA